CDGAWPLEGKLDFVAANKLAPVITLKHRVGGDANNTGVALNGAANHTHRCITSTGAGANFSIDWVISELSAGADVELDLNYDAGGLHYVEVAGAGYILGVPFLLHLSDKVQADELLDGAGLPQNPDLLGTDDIDFEW